ncbi:MAG: VapB-type antitoxin [Candidatus Methanomethylicia archaeon]
MPVISVRVDEKVKQVLKEANIDISREVKLFLENLAWRIEVKKRIERLNSILSGIKPAEEGFSTASIREDRENN